MSKKVDRPTDDQLATAIAWLGYNEGTENGEREACAAVAAWLEHVKFEDWLRREARKAGIPVARLRRRLKESDHGH